MFYKQIHKQIWRATLWTVIDVYRFMEVLRSRWEVLTSRFRCQYSSHNNNQIREKTMNAISYIYEIRKIWDSPENVTAQPAHGRWKDVKTLKQRPYNVRLTSCAGWENMLHTRLTAHCCEQKRRYFWTFAGRVNCCERLLRKTKE